MGATIDYERNKLVATNTTGMDLTLLAGEKPDAPTAIGGTGTTGELDLRVQADADESGGADVQDLFKLETVPTIDSAGVIKLTVTLTPINGDGSDGTAKIVSCIHGQNMDAWQTAAGRARQA